MKYTININQLVLAESGLDFNDGAILDYLCVLAMSVSQQVQKHRVLLRDSDDEEFRQFTWVDLATLLDQLPMLPFRSKPRVSQRISKIAETGYIETRQSASGRLFFALTDKADELFKQRDSDRLENQIGSGKTVKYAKQPVKNIKQDRLENQTNYYTKDSNTKSLVTSKDVVLVYQHFCKQFAKNEAAYKLTPKRRAKLSARLKDAGKDMLLAAIDATANAPFYRGDNDRGWIADLDFIVRSYEQVERLASLGSDKQALSDEEIAKQAMQEYEHGNGR